MLEAKANARPRRDDRHRPYPVNPDIAACIGFYFWKRPSIRGFLRGGRGSPVFCGSAKRAVAIARARRGAVAVWASREPPDLADRAREAGVRVIRAEDGFLRSVGLGADLVPPASIVLDERGIYYDPSRPSDLETILNEAAFDTALLARADRLIDDIVRHGLSKYNLPREAPELDLPSSGRRLLVPGQVEDDRSVMLGGGAISGNLEFLARVRAGNPDAFIVYKPHPDIEAGHRRGAVPDRDARRYADMILRGVASVELLRSVDEVHTLTSLSGFEALMRGVHVTVYGQPFYAGWGLTTDIVPIARRRRRLSLSQLVAGTLILYPRYLDPVTRLPCGPELIVERLKDRNLWRPGALIRMRRWQGALVRSLRDGRWFGQDRARQHP
jgi:capsular polysaccharide export protein